jgi:hypothetical protein
MVSLKKYTKEQILTEGNNRFKKIASMLDKEDLEDMLQQALSWLDQAIFTPRAILFKPEDVMGYNGGFFIDVSPYKIDVINNVYYASEQEYLGNIFFPELGIMPFISGGSYINLSNVADYLSLVTNLNLIRRHTEMDGDYELWPIDEQGRQLLQVKNNNIIRIEYLPNIDRNAEEWYLYDYEYAALKDVLFDMCNIFNYEQLMSAQSLGVSKETTNLVEYWSKKLEADKKEFHDKSLVTALM